MAPTKTNLQLSRIPIKGNAIEIQDIRMKQRIAVCYTHSIVPILAAESYGMPRVEDRVTDCAFYLYRDLKSAQEGSEAGGTGFVLARQYEAPAINDSGVLYLVSNKHVVHSHGCSVARLNKKDGGVDIIELEPHHWIAHPTRDLAASMAFINPAVHQCTWVIYDNLIDRTELKSREIGLGDDVFMVGRFIGHDGKKRNQASVRFGNISMPVGEILNPETGPEESFAVEMRSKPGYSGSPVFVYDFLSSQVTTTKKRDFGFIMLLGVEWGHILERAPVLNAWGTPHENQYVPQPTGMNGVVPAWGLKELLEMPALKQPFEQMQELVLDAFTKQRAIVMPMAAVDGIKATQVELADANPSHKEDFMSLLNAAAKAKPQGD